MNIFFDLDGTLFDVSKKYYYSHTEAAKKTGQKPLPFKKYWDLKRRNLSEDKILKLDHSGLPFLVYEKTRIALLETKKALDLDTPFPWVSKLLDELSLKHDMYIVALRKDKNNLRNQLQKMGFIKYFKFIFSSSPKNSPLLIKKKLIKKVKTSTNDWVVGDTELDIMVARELNLKSVAVYSGIRNKLYLNKFNPDYLSQNAATFFEKTNN